MYSNLSKMDTWAKWILECCRNLIKQSFLLWAKQIPTFPASEILRFPGNLQKPLATVTFRHLEHHEKSYGWMGATLAPPRNQLDPLENHWNSLHFQCAALMRNSACPRHPGGQSGNVMVIRISPKTIGCSDISRSRDVCSRVEELENILLPVRSWLELSAIHTETLQKP